MKHLIALFLCLLSVLFPTAASASADECILHTGAAELPPEYEGCVPSYVCYTYHGQSCQWVDCAGEETSILCCMGQDEVFVCGPSNGLTFGGPAPDWSDVWAEFDEPATTPEPTDWWGIPWWSILWREVTAQVAGARSAECPLPIGTPIPGSTGVCTATALCESGEETGACQIASCDGEHLVCCQDPALEEGTLLCATSRGTDFIVGVDDILWEPEPTTWWEWALPWLWREVVPESPRDPRHISAESERDAAVLSFEYVDGDSGILVDGTVSGGAFTGVHVEGWNYNGSSGQTCGGSDGSACFVPLTSGANNAYSASSGPAGLVLTSGDGSVRLACGRGPVGPVPMAVHDCTAAWSTGAAWSTPTTCAGLLGADLGACVGYAWDMSH